MYKHWGIWIVAVAGLLVAPWVTGSSLSVMLLSQMGIAVVACLSYNVLYGQGGMLSFGHAVYTGMGAYLAMHALRHAQALDLPLPVILLPLLGGLAGLALAAVLGALSTRRAGTTFAMITLALGELVLALALMLPDVFGGEAGVSVNRAAGVAWLGITFGITWGPAIEVYYLIAGYTLLSVALLYAFTRTPLGLLLNAVRDNPQRMSFIGYDARMVRYLAFLVSGFFAGVAGGLAAINFEIVTTESLGPLRSGAYLLFTFLGGSQSFYGPVLGGVLMVLGTVWLSELSRAWLLYLGLLFMWMVIAAPGGLAGLMGTARQWLDRACQPGRWPWSLALLAATALAGSGGVALIEMAYHRQLDASMGPELQLLGLQLDTSAPADWLAAGLVLLIGGFAWVWVRRHLRTLDGAAP